MTDTKPVRSPIEEVLDLLDLEKIEENIFRGQSPEDRMQRVFGGQVLGQALVAASRTVEGRVCHSFHAYFLRGGDPKVPILYEVDRARDGGSFTSRRVVAIQHGKQIFNMSASFQVMEKGLEHQFDMPKVPAPDSLVDEHEARKKWMANAPEEAKAWMSRPRPIEMRPVILDDWMDRKPREPFDNRLDPRHRPGARQCHRAATIGACLRVGHVAARHRAAAAWPVVDLCRSRWRASIMRCGSIIRSRWTTGCSMRRIRRGASGARGFNCERSTRGMASWSRAWCRKV